MSEARSGARIAEIPAWELVIIVVTSVYFTAVGIYNSGVSFTADFTAVDPDQSLTSITPWAV